VKFYCSVKLFQYHNFVTDKRTVAKSSCDFIFSKSRLVIEEGMLEKDAIEESV
jgi:hypothetical protein